MKRVFIQACVKYPHGGALANYIQNLAEAIVYAGYEVILAININKEYDIETVISSSKPIIVIPVIPSEKMAIRQKQRQTGYSAERFGILEKYNVKKDDCVIILDLWSEYFLKKLFELGKEIGFKTICGVFELFEAKDYETIEKYKEFVHIYEEVYLQSDAILSISEYVDHYYINKGMQVYRLPPMVDCAKYRAEIKKTDKYRFIIPSRKDSLRSMLVAFAGLESEEQDKIELHLCGIKKDKLMDTLDQTLWKGLESFIVVHDWMRYEELVNLYRQMHFLVIARDVCQRTLANFPSKVPECMSLGVVPVVSDVGDYTKYYLNDGVDSIFIQGDSAEEIKKSIRKAMALSDAQFNRYSENAVLCAETRFDYHVWSDKVNEMLETETSKKNGSR